MLILTAVMASIAVLVAIGGLLVGLFKRGVNEGRLTEILSTLQKIDSDHEIRIRVLEHAEAARMKT